MIKMKLGFILSVASFGLCIGHLLADVKVGLFNIQVFGKKKMQNMEVRHALVQILSRYDIAGIQEIRDSEGTAILELLRELNEATPGAAYDLVQSGRLGRTSSKEQYAFFYRTDKVYVRDKYQDKDIDDVFEREPYSVRFMSPYTDIGEFGIMIIHTSPSAAETEIDALTTSYETAANALGIKNFIIGGDFNADCSYVTTSEWSSVSLRTDARFTWLVADDADTTVKRTDCAYDRAVAVGRDMLGNIVNGSAQVFNFQEDFDLDEDKAAAISDHYPLELVLKGPEDIDGKNTEISVSSGFKFEIMIPKESVVYARQIYRDKDSLVAIGYDITVYKVGYSINHVVASLHAVQDIIQAVIDFISVEKLFPADVLLRMLRLLNDYVIDSDVRPPNSYTLQVSCSFVVPYRCSLDVRSQLSVS